MGLWRITADRLLCPSRNKILDYQNWLPHLQPAYFIAGLPLGIGFSLSSRSFFDERQPSRARKTLHYLKSHWIIEKKQDP